MSVKVGLCGIVVTLCTVIALAGTSLCAFADQPKVKKLSKPSHQPIRKSVRKHPNPFKVPMTKSIDKPNDPHQHASGDFGSTEVFFVPGKGLTKHRENENAP
jgi:hypothetical protein